MPDKKLMTCCYCGRRTVLKLTARGGHELACGSCGAPVHVMKPLHPQEARAASTHAPTPQPRKIKKPKKSSRKRRKPYWQKLLKDAVEEVIDIFD